MKSCKWKWIVGLVVAVTAVGAIFYFHLPIVLRDLLRRALDWMSSLGMWGPILFLVIYIGSLAHVRAQRPTPVQWVLRAVGLIATVSVTLVLTPLPKGL